MPAEVDAPSDSFRDGIRLFNEEYFFEAHEHLEGLWHKERGEPRQFLQGLIQICAAFEARGVRPLFARDRAETLATVLGLIPKGTTVAHGSSTTLIEIGVMDALKRPDSGVRYLNPEWQAEPDAAQRARLRAKLSVESDTFLGSVQAICETGEVIGSDAS